MTSGERKNSDLVLIPAAPEELQLQTATKTMEKREAPKPNDQAHCCDLKTAMRASNSAMAVGRYFRENILEKVQCLGQSGVKMSGEQQFRRFSCTEAKVLFS